MPSPAAQLHQEQRAVVAAQTATAVLDRWSQVDPEAVGRSWSELLAEVIALVMGGQLTAARQTPAYMRELLGNDGPSVNPTAFSQFAPDGRHLAGILPIAIPATLGPLNSGVGPSAAMARGAAFLDMTVRTIVADTGRQADQASMVANPDVLGYARVLELPSCARCIVLAGKTSPVMNGFLRHPRCDCAMEPVTRDHRPDLVSPRTAFEAMTPEERLHSFGEAGTKAIEDGADIGRIVRARKGMQTIHAYGRTVQTTTALAGRRRTGRVRLTPEAIYEQADSRDEAADLLRIHGYIL